MLFVELYNLCNSLHVANNKYVIQQMFAKLIHNRYINFRVFDKKHSLQFLGVILSGQYICERHLGKNLLLIRFQDHVE